MKEEARVYLRLFMNCASAAWLSRRAATAIGASERMSKPEHSHNRARENFLTVDGVTQPAPVPRYSATAAPRPRMWKENSDLEALLDECGFQSPEVEQLRESGAFG